MFKVLLIATLISSFLFSTVSHAAPLVTGKPVTVQHLGKLDWPADEENESAPSLTQLVANDINDLHGKLSCELIISTPGNYHMALKDAMYGRPDLGHVGLLKQMGELAQFKVSICWSTSPPISVDQIANEELQFKNIKMVGRPSLVMAPGGVMNTLVAEGKVDEASRQPFLKNYGNVMLIRADKLGIINNVCDLVGPTRVVTPHPTLEPGSFGNFSGTIFNVADQNYLGCDATTLFNSIFSQDLASIDMSGFDNPYNIDGVLSAFGRGSTPQGTGAKWVASSRIMHRDIPYALCHDEADVGIIFYHQAKYIMESLKGVIGDDGIYIPGCELAIVPLDGNVNGDVPTPDLPGNRIGTLHIAKVNGSYAKKVNDGRDTLYEFFTTSPIWMQILNEYGMTTP